MLIDVITATFTAGKGGSGLVWYFAATKGKRGKPGGGRGGDGGNIYVQPINDIFALNQFSHTPHRSADNGEAGGPNRKIGKKGQDLSISLPIGTVITDQNTHEIWDITETTQPFIICKGGKGGRGNDEMGNGFSQPGLKGQERNLIFNLKLIAHFGLIGLPNAGKSSLLNNLTAAQAKTANYPFTTLEPNLGALQKHIIADIPGLIEGASAGKGLGIKFLKHIERVNLLIHCISAENENPAETYNTVRSELGEYNPELLEKPEIILLTKTDLIDQKEQTKLINKLKKLNKQTHPVSIHNWDQLEQLKQTLLKHAS